jgi:hypothetical protein
MIDLAIKIIKILFILAIIGLFIWGCVIAYNYASDYFQKKQASQKSFDVMGTFLKNISEIKVRDNTPSPTGNNGVVLQWWNILISKFSEQEKAAVGKCINNLQNVSILKSTIKCIFTKTFASIAKKSTIDEVLVNTLITRPDFYPIISFYTFSIIIIDYILSGWKTETNGPIITFAIDNDITHKIMEFDMNNETITLFGSLKDRFQSHSDKYSNNTKLTPEIREFLYKTDFSKPISLVDFEKICVVNMLDNPVQTSCKLCE